MIEWISKYASLQLLSVVELYDKTLYTYISNTFKVMVVCQYTSNNQ